MGASAAAVIQARRSSSRLPGKVLLPLSGMPVLFHVVERLGRAARVSRVVVATSDRSDDDQLAAACAALGVACVRGPLEDVLGRYALAVGALPEDTIVRVAADKPLLEPRLIDEVIQRHHEVRADYTTNMGAGWPNDAACVLGHEVEVVSKAALLRASREATAAADREHVLPYVYARGRDFKVERVALSDPLAPLAPRLVLDTPDDYRVLATVYEALYRGQGTPIGERELEEFLRARPALLAQNREVVQRGYR